MSRARNIKPGFFKNDLLAECNPLARILFCGLWCEADREGRLEDRPKRIKADCLPYDHCDCEELLSELARRGFIVRYVVDGSRYIAIPEFLKHQNPHCKESASSIPAPDKHGARTVQAEDESSESTQQTRLIPDSLIPHPDSREDQKRAPQAARSVDRFPEFWSMYPLKKGKSHAEKTWKLRKLDVIADRIIADVHERAASDRQWLDGFIPHGSTYVNGRGWEDAIQPRSTGQPTNGTMSKALSGIQKLQAMRINEREQPRLAAERDSQRAIEADDPEPRPPARCGPD